MPRYVVIDTETSGLPMYAKKGEPPPPADHPGQPRLVSFTALVTTPDLEVDEDQSITALIRPEGWEMTAGATAVNGITTQMALDKGINVRDVLSIYSEYITNGWIVVCHNCIFDLKIMRGELRRHQMPDLFEATKNVCTQADFIEVFKLPPTGKQMASGRYAFKQPKLIEAYRHFFGCDFEDAHSSMADARATLAVFRKLVESGIPIEPKIRYAKSHAGA